MNTFKILFALLAVLLLQSTISGQEDISLTAPLIDPSPLEFNGSGQLKFTINNVNGSYPEDSGVKIEIELFKVRPLVGASSVSGSEAFEWSYDENKNTLQGTQINEIGFLFSERIIIDIIVVEFSAEPGNVGFIATALASIDGNSKNNTGSSFTWTTNNDYGISGTVFHDVNQNQVQDENEFGVDGIKIDIITDDATAISNKNGSYIYKAEEGTTYTVSPDLGDEWLLTTEDASITHTFENANPGNYNNDFGIIPVNMSTEIFANLSSDPTICNRAINYKLRYVNRGTEVESGQLRLAMDSKIELLHTSENFTTENIYHVWEVSNLSPNESKEINLFVKMPSEEEVGNLITMDYYFIDTEAGTDVEAFADTYESTILCAYDPNDKIVFPAGEEEENYTNKDQALQYTIRFQNTGNAPARDVLITDDIDPNLDLATLRVTNSSEDVLTGIIDREVSFLFKDIYLIDSLADEPNSHGFISYIISPLDEIDDFTKVENTANIFFDDNPPIGTNTTLNTLVDQLSSSNDLAEKYDILLYPNPTDGAFQISSSHNIQALEIFSASGQLVYKNSFSNVNFVPIESDDILRSGIYYIKLNIEKEIVVKKLTLR